MISNGATEILEEWKKLAREYAAEIQRGDAKCRELQTEIERLRAEIDAMRKQEPAYWGPRNAVKNRWDSLVVRSTPAGPEDVPLYLAPGAQTAPSVPAPIEGAKYMSNDWYYAEGWNDCRHAMLDAQENNDGRN